MTVWSRDQYEAFPVTTMPPPAYVLCRGCGAARWDRTATGDPHRPGPALLPG